MYFPLEINEQLANAMRAAAEAIFKSREEKNNIIRADIASIDELDEILCDVICRIAGLTSSVISACAIDESDKEVKNRLNTKDHVSE